MYTVYGNIDKFLREPKCILQIDNSLAREIQLIEVEDGYSEKCLIQEQLSQLAFSKHTIKF